MNDQNNHDEVGLLAQKVHELGVVMEKMKLAEYIALFDKPARLFFINFFAGVARGIGMAIGFTILGALLLYTLQRLQVLNLPVVGSVIADIVRIVQLQLKMH